MGVIMLDSRSAISGANVCVNTWHVGCASQPSVAEANSIVSAINTYHGAHATWKTTSSTVVTGTRVLYFAEGWWTKPTFDANGKLLTKGKFNTEPIIIGATPLTSGVGAGGTAIPPQLATVVSWRTVVSGRSGRGRSYLGNWGSNANANPIVTPALVTAINTSSATLITAVAAVAGADGPFNLGVWSPTKGVIRPILSGATDAVFDTMRSRVK